MWCIWYIREVAEISTVLVVKTMHEEEVQTIPALFALPGPLKTDRKQKMQYSERIKILCEIRDRGSLAL